MTKNKIKTSHNNTPIELKKIIDLLEKEILKLDWQWENFYNLFGLDDGRIELMNKSAGSFFYYIQKGLIENIVLSISRLTDPIKSRNYSNLSINLLPELIDNEQLKATTIQKLNHINTTVQFARKWRSKKYAHNDFDTTTGKAKLTTEITKENIENCLNSIKELMHIITLFYRNTKTYYSYNQYESSNLLLSALQNHLNVKEYIMNLRCNNEQIPQILKTERFKKI